MDRIMGKSINDYIKVVKLPLAVWIFCDLVEFAVGMIFANEIAAVQAAGPVPAAVAVTPGVLIAAIVGLVWIAISILIGVWIGWRTLTVIRGAYRHAALAAIIAVAINIAVSFALGIVSLVITPSALGIAVAIVRLIESAILGFVVWGAIAIIMAVIGMFVARKMKRK